MRHPDDWTDCNMSAHDHAREQWEAEHDVATAPEPLPPYDGPPPPYNPLREQLRALGHDDPEQRLDALDDREIESLAHYYHDELEFLARQQARKESVQCSF